MTGRTLTISCAAIVVLLAAAAAHGAPAAGARPAANSKSPAARARLLERYSATAHVNDCLALGPRGTYAATRGGLLYIHPSGSTTRTLRLPTLGTRAHVLLRRGDALWVGGERGLVRLALSRAAKTPQLRRRFATRAPVRALLVSGNRLYIGTWGDGLWRLDLRRGDARLTRVRFVRRRAPRTLHSRARGRARRRVSALLADGKGLLAATDAGLYRLGTRQRRLQRSARGRALPQLPIFALTLQGDTLLAATLGGLYAVEASGAARLVNVADVRAFARSGKRLLAASFGEGLLHVTHSGKTLTARRLGTAPRGARFLGAASWTAATVAANAPGKAGTLCVGGRDGLWVGSSARALRRVRVAALRSADIAAMARVGRVIYLGTFDRGLARLRPTSGGSLVIEHLPLATVGSGEARINALAVDDRGALWVASARGLYRLSPALARGSKPWRRAKRPRRIARADGLPSDAVLALAPLRRGGVLAGTGRGAALVRLGDGAAYPSVQLIGRKQGLAARAVWSVAARAGTLWLGTARGLYRSRGQCSGAAQSSCVYASAGVTRLSVASGHLADDWVTAIAVAKDGTVYAGSYNAGVSRLSAAPDAKHGLEAKQLGGGWVNLAGLRVEARWLYAATMSGLRRLALGAATWQSVPLGLGRDVTASLRSADGHSAWVSTRRGVARVALLR